MFGTIFFSTGAGRWQVPGSQFSDTANEGTALISSGDILVTVTPACISQVGFLALRVAHTSYWTIAAT